MKLLIDGKYAEVGFWSFLKLNFLTSLMIGFLWLVFWFVIFFAIGVMVA